MPTNYTEIFFVRPEKLKRYKGALTEAKKQSLKIALGEMDDLGRHLVKELQTNAPTQKGEFASGFTYRVKKTGADVGSLYVNWYPKDRPKNLLEWITFGTGIHGPRKRRIVPRAVWANEKRVAAGKKPKAIPANKPKFLQWQNPTTGQWYRKKSVAGMRPNRFVFSVWLQAQDRIAAIYQNIGKLVADRILEKSNRL